MEIRQQFVADPIWNAALNALARPGASELVVNGPDGFFVTYQGKKEHIRHGQPLNIRSYIDSIKNNLIPLVDSELPFDPEEGYIFEGHYKVPGSGGFEGRCHIAVKPITDVPLITMTKIAETTSTIESIAESGSMATEMMNFLIDGAKAKLTMVLSGQSGAGKTTTLQALTKYFSDQDRIGVGEDLPELKLSQTNAFYLHTLPARPGMDPNRVADLSFVVKQFLRMRPDRVIIGETRGKEFADFLVACNAGMEGSMTTLHASDPSGALDKMTRFALQGSDKQPIRSINQEIGSAVDLVIQLGRINGRHRVTHIQEITKIVGDREDAKLTSQTLYEYRPLSDDWVKKNMMTDKLIEKFNRASIDIKNYMSTPVDTELQKHRRVAQSPVNEGGSFSGGNPFSGASGRRI